MILNEQDRCCICGSMVTMYSKGMAHVDAPWGQKFSLTYHLACENKEVLTKMLNEMVNKAKTRP